MQNVPSDTMQRQAELIEDSAKTSCVDNTVLSKGHQGTISAIHTQDIFVALLRGSGGGEGYLKQFYFFLEELSQLSACQV